MGRVIRRTPYYGVRFSFRKLDSGVYGYVAVKPCGRCSAWKTDMCNNCDPANSKDIEQHIKRRIEFHHNWTEDYPNCECDIKHKFGMEYKEE